MDSRRLVAMLLVLSAVAVVTCNGQDLQPILDRTRRVEIPGVSVLPPQGDNWFLFPVDPQEPGPATAGIRFNQRFAQPVKPEDARMVYAGVVVQDSGYATSPSPAKFLEDFKREFVKDGKVRVGEMLTPRQRLLEFNGALDDSLGATCVRYTRRTEITGRFRAFPDLITISSTRGMFCSHPQWPQYDINVMLTQIYARGQEPLPRDGESEAFLKGIVFTAAQPTSVNKALEISTPR